nr:nucleotidyltransferase domain-containing protein [Neoroseomonas nitratireducens]
MDAEQPHRRQEREARHGRSLDRLRAVVGEWAQGEPLVRMVWLIGSRAVGDPYPGSDVDLVLSLSSDPAVVAQGAQGRGAVLTLMRQDRREAWQAALQERIAQEVQVLVLFRDNDIVRDAVKREGVCLYRRRAAPGLRKAP